MLLYIAATNRVVSIVLVVEHQEEGKAQPVQRPAVAVVQRNQPHQNPVRKPGGSPDPSVGIVMGSDSDWRVMEGVAAALDEFDVAYEVGVVSAHRMPEQMIAYGRQAAARGLRVVVAGAGGAAHLPGMLAAVTPLPVIGVPVALAHLDGMDSLLSIVQMPAGVPVATVSIGGARNAGLLAVKMLAIGDDALSERLDAFAADLEAQVAAKNDALVAGL